MQQYFGWRCELYYNVHSCGPQRAIPYHTTGWYYNHSYNEMREQISILFPEIQPPSRKGVYKLNKIF